MKKIIRSVFFAAVLTGSFLIPHEANAQIVLNLALNARPQPFLADWVNPINGVMVISYMAGPLFDDPAVKLRTTLLDGGGNVIGSSNTSAAGIYHLKNGVNQFTMADALQLQNLNLAGSIKTQLQRTGRIPPGQYQLMVEVTNAGGDIIRAKQSKPFFVVSHQLPVLIAPANGAGLEARLAQNVIVFRWTPVVPALQQGVPTYLVQVFEVLPGQTPMQAFRGNRPLLDDQAIKGATQYVWRPSLPMIDSTANRQFIWTIQTLDADGAPIPTADMNIQGRSQPAIFNITHPAATVVKKEDQIKTEQQ